MDRPKDKGILTPTEVANLATIPYGDPRAKLAMLLAAECGVRRGEVLAVRWMDVNYEKNFIHVCRNYVNNEGFKAPKNGKPRKVPLPARVLTALAEVKAVSPWTEPDDLVVFNPKKHGEPVSEDFTRATFARALAAIGIPEAEQATRNLNYHGLRHTFITLARLAGIPELVIQAIAGHKDKVMMDHYSHADQVIDFGDAIAKLETALRPNREPV